MPHVLYANAHAVLGEHDVLLLHLLLASVGELLGVEVDLLRKNLKLVRSRSSYHDQQFECTGEAVRMRLAMRGLYLVAKVCAEANEGEENDQRNEVP